MAPSHLFVCLMGLGTVFLGLLCIICLCKLMSTLCIHLTNTDHTQPTTEEVVPTSSPLQMPNHKQFVAAVSAAIAEDLGTDISAIRIVSIKKL